MSSRRPRGHSHSSDARSIFTVSQAYYNIAARAHAMWPSTLNSAKKESVILQVTLNYNLHLKPIFMQEVWITRPIRARKRRSTISSVCSADGQCPHAPVHIVVPRGSGVMSALCNEEGRDGPGERERIPSFTAGNQIEVDRLLSSKCTLSQSASPPPSAPSVSRVK